MAEAGTLLLPKNMPMSTDPTQSQELKQLARQAMRDRGLLPEFSPRALQEAEAFIRANIEAGPAIRDMRSLLWSSIDNDDSRDLDQLEVVQPLDSDAIQVLVAIADVDSMVKMGSAIDAHARANTTSVYTAAQIFPMLPEQLSTDLTSLVQGQERMCIVFEMNIAADGSVQNSAVYRAVVVNHAKLAYRAVAAWLDGAGPTPDAIASVPGMEQQLRSQDEVAHRMRQRRLTQGALEFETLQDRAVFADGLLVDLRPDPKNRAQNLIEDLMIAANGVSARFLQHKGFPSLRRVLGIPKRWDRIVALAREAGEQLPATPGSAALSTFLVRRRQAEPARFPDLSLSIIKLLGSGEYALELPGEKPDGHFGLAVRDYSHSTAPNRRFPDLLTQRLIKSALLGRPAPYGIADLQLLATHCTEQEDNASKVERQVRKSAAAMLLSSHLGNQFDAIVTGASDKGTWVRVSHPSAEGRVVQGFEGLDVGDHVRVRLARTDMARGFIDFVVLR